MHFFLDNCVPQSVGLTLEELGHNVVYLREVMVADSPDELVAAYFEENAYTLITIDKDFKRLISKGKYKKLSKIQLECSEPKAAGRIKVAISFIEHEWHYFANHLNKPMLIAIGNEMLRSHR